MNKVFGVTGWKNSGKTTLVSSLVAEFTRQGQLVSTVKNSHHKFKIDHEGTDTFNHRAAGAHEVAIVSEKRWALMHEVQPTNDKPTLETMLSKLAPCDLVLVEGFKPSKIPKIESIRSEFAREKPIWPTNDSIIAVATDSIDPNCPRPQFALDDISAISKFIAQQVGLQL